ncbi:MAG: gamma-glutamylcyclotransferase family protein [Micrococcaceae bacterium]
MTAPDQQDSARAAAARPEGLFIYGTLGPGRPNEHILEPLNGTWQPAEVIAELFNSGWGAASGYPGLRLDGPASQRSAIAGWLFRSDTLDEHWEYLDRFEGPGYQRVIAMVRLTDDEDDCAAWVYALAETPDAP